MKLFYDCIFMMQVPRGDSSWETWQLLNQGIVTKTMVGLNGGIVDRGVLHELVDTYHKAEENQEAELLQASADLDDKMTASIGSFFRERANCWMAESTVGAYCRLVRRSLAEAQSCILEIFPKPKSEILVSVVEKELIAAKTSDMLHRPTGVRHMLQNGRRSELGDVYYVISRIHEGAASIGESSWISHLQSNLDCLESGSEDWFRPNTSPSRDGGKPSVSR